MEKISKNILTKKHMKNQKPEGIIIGGREVSPRELAEYFKSQGCTDYESVSGHLKEIVKPTLQGLLEAELEINSRTKTNKN